MYSYRTLEKRTRELARCRTSAVRHNREFKLYVVVLRWLRLFGTLQKVERTLFAGVKLELG